MNRRYVVSTIAVWVSLLHATPAIGRPVQQAPPARTSDLDQLMERVVSKRDDSWAQMRQYILDEQEILRIIGPTGAPLYGFARDYTWFIRDGFFIRSPLEADGVTVDEAERVEYEAEWMRRERRRLGEQREEAAQSDDPRVALDAVLDQSLQPRFVSAAYFLEFDFDPGQYAFVGREMLAGVEVLRIEYYPTRLFDEGRSRPNRRVRERDDEVEAKLNKATLVTLWVDPTTEQIRRYRVEGLDWSFLPGRSIVRVEQVEASMSMQEAFPGVWLPDTIEMEFGLAFAFGEVSAQYRVHYHDYRRADVTSTIRPGRR